MSRLYLYSIFHANLNFSYIPPDLYPQILERCYWPLLRIVEEQEVPLGLEFSGYTLQLINRLDSTFVKRLRQLWERGVCEVIGSGYVQSIMPLIPSKVNRENLRIGNEVYQRLLGNRPSMAFVNEQVYSAGLPSLYREAGYRSLMINWEAALPAHLDRELLYRPCAVSLGDTGDEGGMPVLWHSLEAYRTFQQYIENEISLDTFLDHLNSHLPPTGERAFQLYGSDWEVFDFKPWQVQPEGFQQVQLGEMRRISELLSLLKQRDDLEIVSPSQVIALSSDLPMVYPESAANPIIYKKQDQHSTTRWAVSGRDNIRLNSQCHQLYQKLQLADWNLRHDQGPSAALDECRELWKELCFLWSSDFRTFTTEEKYLEFRNRMGATMARAEQLGRQLQPSNGTPDNLWLTNCSMVPATSEPTTLTFKTNGRGAEGFAAYQLSINGQSTGCQAIEGHAGLYGSEYLTLEAIPDLGPEQSAVATVRQVSHSGTTRESVCRLDTKGNSVETPAVSLALSPAFGGTIESLAFPKISPEPLICRPDHDWPQSTAEHDGLFVGGLEFEDMSGRRVTDDHPADVQYPQRWQDLEIFVPVRCVVQTEAGTIWKTYRVYIHQPRIDLVIRFQWRDLVPKYFRLGRIALNSDAFDRSTLYYATVNGGEDIERFQLQGLRVSQDEALGPDRTASGCLGATEGWVALGDATKGVGLVTRPAALYSVPLLRYQESEQSPEDFLLTVVHSLGEHDETNHILWRGHSTWFLSILGGKEDIIARTRVSALLANGGLVAQSA